VLNTCTVTSSADVETRRLIRNLHRDCPGTPVLVTGCYAQRDPDALARMENVRWVVGNSHKTEIPNIVLHDNVASSEQYHGRVIVGDIAAQTGFTSAVVTGPAADRARPNLKVQDGCSNRCAFCVIPSVRGRSRSASLDSVIAQLRQLSLTYPEVVLTGINLGRWGRDIDPNLRFTDLIRAAVSETNIRRLRISSVEPMDWSEDLFRFIADSPRIAEHVHMPLQSACDSVLKRMRRKYRLRHYRSRLELVGKWLPDAAVGADVLTGFPGETDAEFTETCDFINSAPFTYLHVFTYSERPGTEAAAAPNQVPVDVRRERTRILRQLSDEKNLEFRRRMVGRTVSAVTLEHRGHALTSNFIKVELAGLPAPNQIIDVKLAQISGAGMREAALLPVLR
jgi:threonylcarbamoyladenosine tRNA methylthiotransferase MtaB